MCALRRERSKWPSGHLGRHHRQADPDGSDRAGRGSRRLGVSVGWLRAHVRGTAAADLAAAKPSAARSATGPAPAIVTATQPAAKPSAALASLATAALATALATPSLSATT